MGKRYENRIDWLQLVNQKHPKGKACDGCPLRDVGAGFARTTGRGSNGIGLVGEALGETEAEKGLPFQGEAGMMLNKILHRVGIKRDEFLIMNTLNCNPPRNLLKGESYELGAIHHCSPYFDETLREHSNLRVLVPMGNTATRKLLGNDGVYTFHGTVHWHPVYKMWVVPTFHPSYLLQSPYGAAEILTIISDLNKAFEVAQYGFTRSPIDYIEYPTLDSASEFVRRYEEALRVDPETWLSCDIETPYSADLDEEDKDAKDSSWTIERISFAFKEGHAITMPFTEPFIGISRRLLASRGIKLFWNGNKFDVPRIRNAGIRIGGIIIDMMDGWHFLYSDLPRGLGYASPFFTDIAPWKHLSATNMPYYSCVDADSALRIGRGVRKRLEKDKLWDVFLRDFVYLEPTFQSMTNVGIGIDTAKQDELRSYYVNLRDNSNAIIQELVPDEVKPLIKKGGYKGKPKDVRLLKQTEPEWTDDQLWHNAGYQLILDNASGEMRYNKRGDFNSNSTLQIREYITWKYGIEALPKDKKTGKVTTGNEEIEKLARGMDDKVLYTIIDASSAGDKLSSFIDNWPIASDGRVHPTFTNNPATFRLSSVRPNSQNFPHRSEELDKLRAMIIAGQTVDDDWWIVEADYSGIEAIQVGWYANDKDYERLAKMGVHSFLSAAMLGDIIDLKLSDADLRIAIGQAKKRAKKELAAGTQTAIYDVAKRVIHGSNYGMGIKLMHDSYPEAFPSQAHAKKLQDMYFDLFPKVKKWQESIVDLAYDQCCVTNAFGYRRWFWDAKRWTFSQRLNDWELVPSGDAKKVISTLPQGSAAAIIRRAMLSEAFQELVDRKQAMIQIHDSLVCRARKKDVDKTIDLLYKAMVYPIREQGGLVIPTETKVGKNWRSFHESDNTLGMKEV